MVEHRLVERHRDFILGPKSHRRVELARVLDERQLDGANHHALVRDPEADRLAQLVGREELAQDARQLLLVPNLAIGDNARCEGGDRRATDRPPAIAPNLSGGDAPGLEVQPDDPLCFLPWRKHP